MPKVSKKLGAGSIEHRKLVLSRAVRRFFLFAGLLPNSMAFWRRHPWRNLFLLRFDGGEEFPPWRWNSFFSNRGILR